MAREYDEKGCARILIVGDSWAQGVWAGQEPNNGYIPTFEKRFWMSLKRIQQ
jgi:hypothetical protein